MLSINNELKLGFYTDALGDIIEILEIVNFNEENSDVRFKVIQCNSEHLNEILNENSKVEKFFSILCRETYKYLAGYNTSLWKTLNK